MNFIYIKNKNAFYTDLVAKFSEVVARLDFKRS
jgi:hypothetical protein